MDKHWLDDDFLKIPPPECLREAVEQSLGVGRRAWDAVEAAAAGSHNSIMLGFGEVQEALRPGPAGDAEFEELARRALDAWAAVAKAVPGSVVGRMCQPAFDAERFDLPLPEGSGAAAAASFEACFSLAGSTPEISRARARFMALDWERLPAGAGVEAGLACCRGMSIAADPATGFPLPGELGRTLPKSKMADRDRRSVAKATTYLCALHGSLRALAKSPRV